MTKQEATKVIALALAEQGGYSIPKTYDWEDAKLLAQRIEAHGHISFVYPEEG